MPRVDYYFDADNGEGPLRKAHDRQPQLDWSMLRELEGNGRSL
jgi:hypothetical protein